MIVGPMALYEEVDVSAGLTQHLFEALEQQITGDEEYDETSGHVYLLEHLAANQLMQVARETGITDMLTTSFLLRQVKRFAMWGIRFGYKLLSRVATAVVSIARSVIYNIGRVVMRFVIQPIITAIGSFLASPIGWPLVIAGAVGLSGYFLYKYLVDGDTPREDAAEGMLSTPSQTEMEGESPYVTVEDDGEYRVGMWTQKLLDLDQDPRFSSAVPEAYESTDPRSHPSGGGAPVSQAGMQQAARNVQLVGKPVTGRLTESALVNAMNNSGILHPVERAMFMAQMSHESGSFRYAEEIWGPTSAQSRYDTNKNLGNKLPGDGYKYRGRGYIQLTGRYNYGIAGKYLGLDLLNNPDWASDADIAALIAIWYWQVARPKIPANARAGDINAVTKLINGGYNGLEDRKVRYAAYLKRDDITQMQQVQIASVPPPTSIEAPAKAPTQVVVDPGPSAPASAVVAPNDAHQNVTYTPYKGAMIEVPA